MKKKRHSSVPCVSYPCSHHLHHLLLLRFLWGIESAMSQLALRAGLHQQVLTAKGEHTEVRDGWGVPHWEAACLAAPSHTWELQFSPHCIGSFYSLFQAKQGHIYWSAEMPVQHRWCSSDCCCGSFCMKINTIEQRSLLSPIFDRSKFCRTCKLLA